MVARRSKRREGMEKLRRVRKNFKETCSEHTAKCVGGDLRHEVKVVTGMAEEG